MKPASSGDDPLGVTTRVWITLQRTRGGRFAGDTFKGVRAVIHGFQGERISLRAAALTYISIFSLVPILTVALVLINSLHQQQFQAGLLNFIHEMFAPGIREESAALFSVFLDRASSVTAGSIGFLMLLISAGSLLKNLDASLNEIWGVRRKRPLVVRFLYYAGILLLGPLLLAVGLVGTSTLRHLLISAHFPYWHELFSAGAFFTVTLLLTSVYYLAPNAPVRFRSALAGGMVAGAGWELARYTYAAFGSQIFAYNPIYGALGELPLFLVWIYLSWLMVLFGARLAYAVEYASFHGSYRALGNHPRARELVAAQMAQLITLAELEDYPAPTPRELAKKLEVPVDVVLEIAERLELAELVEFGSRGSLHPARHPDNLTVAELSAAVGGVISLLTAKTEDQNKTKEFQQLEAIFVQIDRATVDRLGRVTWTSLVASLRTTQKPVSKSATPPLHLPAAGRNP